MKKEHYRTADVTLAAVILSITSAHLLLVDRKKEEAEFVFFRDDVPEEIVEAYERGDLRIEPVTFSMVLRYVMFKATKENEGGE